MLSTYTLTWGMILITLCKGFHYIYKSLDGIWTWWLMPLARARTDVFDLWQKPSLPEGPNNCMLSLRRLSSHSRHLMSAIQLRSTSQSLLSSQITMTQTSTYCNILWKDDGAQTHARALTVAPELLLRSGAFSSILVQKLACGLKSARNPVITV